MRATYWTLGAILVFSSSTARAAEEEGRITESRHGVDVIGTTAVGDAMSRTGLAGPSLAVEAGGYWKLSPAFALGLVGGRTWVLESSNAVYGLGQFQKDHTDIWHVAPVLRWDYHRARWTSAWLGANFGIALLEQVGTDNPPNSALPPVPATRTRGAARFGADAGFALVPARWLSVAVEAKLVDVADAQGYFGVYGGLALGFHIPVGERIPR